MSYWISEESMGGIRKGMFNMEYELKTIVYPAQGTHHRLCSIS